MQIITLRDNHSKHFTLTTYPDGQRNITLNLDMLNVKEHVDIFCSIKNFDELEVLICLICALKSHDFYIDELYFAYLFGMRSDRKFENGQASYFRMLIAPILNTYIIGAKIPHVRILSPHSNVAHNELGALPVSAEFDEFIHVSTFEEAGITPPFIFLAADEGAQKRDEVAKSDGFFYKKRTDAGITVELTSRALNLIAHNLEIPVVIIDDLCDGGGTFIAIAKYLREKGFNNPLTLIITHALFTKGVDVVAEHYDKIICTNSYQDISHPKVQQVNVFEEYACLA